MLKVAAVANRLNLSVSKVYELIDAGRLGHHRMDGAIRVSEEQLQAYLEETKRGPGEVPKEMNSSRPRLRHVHL